jgi:single-strand DNA-binding protein
VNILHIAGHLGADPEVRYTPSGLKVTVLRVAAKLRRPKKNSPKDTIWWRVTIWGEQFDKMLAFFKKGSSILVVGEIDEPEIYNDREGKTQISMGMTATALYFSPFGKPSSDRPQQTAAPAAESAQETIATGAGSDDAMQALEDEVPF